MTTSEPMPPTQPTASGPLGLPFDIDIVLVPSTLAAALADAITDRTRPASQEGAIND